MFDWPAGFNPGSGALLAINEDLAKSYDALAYVANNVLNMQHTRTALRGVLDMKSWGKATQCLWKVLEDMRDEALLKLAKCEKDYNTEILPMPRVLRERLLSILGKEKEKEKEKERKDRL